jgi:predicted 2-oxoglutarate/Fe(II)-dependent dioxygenase YbiX
MIEFDAKSHFDLHIVKDFLDAATCRRLSSEMHRSPSKPALTYGKSESAVIDERVRRVVQVLPSAETIDLIQGRLREYRLALEQRFGIRISECESAQFLRYRVGDFFVAHQDGNTGLLKLKSDEGRRVSVSIFLNCESEVARTDTYGGGSLVFSDWRHDRRFQLQGEAGTLVAFRSGITHEVTPVTRGERYAIVTWFG